MARERISVLARKDCYIADGADLLMYTDNLSTLAVGIYNDEGKLVLGNVNTTDSDPGRQVYLQRTHVGALGEKKGLTGIEVRSTFNGSAAAADSEVKGGEFKARHTDANVRAVGTMKGVVGNVDSKTGAKTITSAWAVEGQIDCGVSSTITTGAGLRVAYNEDGAVTNAYGVYIDGASVWNIGVYCRGGKSVNAIQVGEDGVGGGDVKFFGATSGCYFEWDESADRLNVVVSGRTVTGEEHAVDVSHAATIGSGESMVGVNVTVTPSGTDGLWASAFYGKVNVTGNALPGTGYCSGAEFEVQYSSGITPSDMWILSLNSSNNASMSPGSAFIATHQYGTGKMLHLFNFTDESLSGDATAMVANTTTIPAVNDSSWVKIKCRVAGTDIWIPATTTGPD